MEWVQVLSLFAANAGLIFWFRSEYRADHRQAIDLIIAIQQEMKDFHGRLERNDAEFKTHMASVNLFLNEYKDSHAFTEPKFIFDMNGVITIKIGAMEIDEYNLCMKNIQN